MRAEFQIENQRLGGQGQERIAALDALRGLAVLGMYIQHFALNEWNGDLVSGNTMILFMMCSGMSYALMEQSVRQRCRNIKKLRVRILARSLAIDLAGYCLLLLNGPFGMVLPAYAMLFLGAMPLLRCGKGQLIGISGLLFAVSPPLMIIGLSLFSGAALLEDIAGGPLSALAWAPVFVLGMALGRMDLRDKELPGRLIGTGIALLIPVELFSELLLPVIREHVENWMVRSMAGAAQNIDPYAVWPHNTSPVQWHMLFVDAPQSGTLFELLAGTGLSLAALGAALLLGRGKRKGMLTPFATVGKISLTMYGLQFILAWGLQLAGIDVTSLGIGSLPCGGILTAVVVLAVGVLLARANGGILERMVRRFEGVFC